jgi:hypothetical protein
VIIIIQFIFLSLKFKGGNMSFGKKSMIYIMVLLFMLSFLTISPVINSVGNTVVSIDDVEIFEDGSDWGLLSVNNVSNLGSCDVTLSWDSDVVFVTDVSDSDFDFMEYYVDDIAGILNVVAFSYDAMNGDFTIAKVTFEPVSNDGECNLEITESKLMLFTAEPFPTEIDHVSVDGTAKVYPVGSTGEINMEDVNVPLDGSNFGFIMVNDVSNLGSCDVTLSWDPDVVNVTDVSDSDFDSIYYYVDNNSGVLNLVAFSYGAMNGDFTIAKVTFEPASGVSINDECNLRITDSTLFTAEPIPGNIFHIRTDGKVKIYPPGITSEVSMDDVNVPEDGSDFGLLMVNDVSNLGSCDVTLSWDPDVVSLTDVSDSDFDSMDYYVDHLTGILVVNAFSYDAMSGDFIIAMLNFEPATLAIAGDECDLEIANSSLLTADPIPSEILHLRTDGSALIKSAPTGDDDDDTTGDDDDDSGGGGLIINENPIADASRSETTGYVNSPVLFDGSLSSDPDGTIDRYKWDWNDDGVYDFTSTYHTTTYSYDEAGSYLVTLKVYDNDGATDKDTINVEISIANNPPTKPVIDGPTTGHKNTEYEYTAVSTDPDNDSIQYIFDWDDGEKTTTEFLSNGTVTNQTHSWTSAGEYTISVKAFDNITESGSTEYTVLIDIWPIDNDINGYLEDDDSDGIFDYFYNSETGNKTDVELQDDGTYLIDIDNDGDWDYVYDVDTDTHTDYEKPDSEEDNTALYILALLIILLLIIFGYLVKRDKDKKKAKKKAEEEKKARQKAEEEKKAKKKEAKKKQPKKKAAKSKK